MVDDIEKFILLFSKRIGFKKISVIRKDRYISEIDSYIQDNKIYQPYANLYNITNIRVTGDNGEIHKIIVVEALSQIKAINAAKKLDNSTVSRSYIDLPSSSGNNRMHGSENRINIFDGLEDQNCDHKFSNYINTLFFENIYSALDSEYFEEIIVKIRSLWNGI